MISKEWGWKLTIRYIQYFLNRSSTPENRPSLLKPALMVIRKEAGNNMISYDWHWNVHEGGTSVKYCKLILEEHLMNDRMCAFQKYVFVSSKPRSFLLEYNDKITKMRRTSEVPKLNVNITSGFLAPVFRPKNPMPFITGAVSAARCLPLSRPKHVPRFSARPKRTPFEWTTWIVTRKMQVCRIQVQMPKRWIIIAYI